MGMDIYQIVTDRIISALESGVVPWRKTWTSASGPAMNLISGKPYRGVNVLLTGMAGFSSPYWVTFKQAKTLGGSVRKGEKGTPVVFWNLSEREQTDGSTKKIPFMKYYTVFNVTQCEGLTLPEAAAKTVDAIAVAEAAVEAWKEKPVIRHGFDGASYRPLADEVTMPNRDAFESAEAYYATLFHELIHSTGSDDRLKRFTAVEGQFNFGSESYSQEELVAEIGAAMVATRIGLTLDEVNTAAYIQTWLKRLKSDKKFIFSAARDAQKATDAILGSVEDSIIEEVA